MKLFTLALLALACAILPLSAQEKAPNPFSIKSSIDGKTVFKSGSKVSFKLECAYPDDYQVSGWNVFAYLRNVPEDFCKKLNLQPKINKDPQWSSVQFQPYQWLPAAQRDSKKVVCSFSTENWPAGDYSLSISVLFQKKDKKEKLPDVYRQGSLVFTLEK